MESLAYMREGVLMGFGVTTIFYLVIGAGVAAAVFLAEEGRSPAGRALRAASERGRSGT